MKRCGNYLFIILCACVCALSILIPAKAGYGEERQVTMILVPGLSWDLITPESAPNLAKMIDQGGAATINLPFNGNDVSGYLALGSGGRAVFGKEGITAYQSNEQVSLDYESAPVTGAQLYTRNTGEVPNGQIVVPDIESLKKMGQASRNTFVPGALGGAVTDTGGRVSVIGNSDLAKEVYRPAVLVAMDRNGQTNGNVDQSLLRKDSTYLYGVSTEWQKLLHAYHAMREQTNLLLVEPGNITRFAAKRTELDPDHAKYLYRKLLAETDQFIGEVANGADSNHLVIVVSPTSFANIGIGAKGAGIVLINGGDIEPGSVLTSNTTRQTGFCTIYDIAPTVLSFLGLPEQLKGGLGQPIGGTSPRSGETSLLTLKNQIQSLSVVNQNRQILVKGFVELMLALTLIGLVVRWVSGRNFRWLERVIVLVMVFPIVFLLLPALGETLTVALFWGKFLLLLGFVWAGLSFIQSNRSRLLVISGVTTGLLMVDMLQQGKRMKESVLGFDMLNGARYYGIGNEYMGILVGSSLLFLYLLKNQFPLQKRLTTWGGGLLFAMIVLLLGLPRFGTNSGGALAATLGFLYTWLAAEKMPTVKKKWPWMGIGFLVVLFGMLASHFWLPSMEQTHIGRTAHLLTQGEFSEIMKMITRKWLLNWRLLHVSVWGSLFTAVGVVLLFDAASGWFKYGRVERFNFAACSLVSGLALFLLNDSGVLAAAGCMLYSAVSVLGLTEKEINEQSMADFVSEDDLSNEGAS